MGGGRRGEEGEVWKGQEEGRRRRAKEEEVGGREEGEEENSMIKGAGPLLICPPSPHSS